MSVTIDVDTARIVEDRDYALALTRLVLRVLLDGIDREAIGGLPPAESFAIGARSGERHGENAYVVGRRDAGVRDARFHVGRYRRGATVVIAVLVLAALALSGAAFWSGYCAGRKREQRRLPLVRAVIAAVAQYEDAVARGHRTTVAWSRVAKALREAGYAAPEDRDGS